MITYRLNNHLSLRDLDNSLTPRLAFMCKAEGAEDAIPRLMHKHDDRFEVMFVVSGGGIFNIDGRTYNVKKGDIMLFNANILHDEDPEVSSDLLIFSCGVHQLKVEGLPVNVLTTRAQPAVLPSGDRYEDLCQILNQMWTHVNNQRLYSSEIVNNLLKVLLLTCCSLWEGNNQKEEIESVLLGQRIKDYIDDYYKEDITLASLTSALNLNHFYLAHVFKDFSGYSPKHYQTRRRIGEAQNLLLSTDFCVNDVASAVGYDNVNNFHRIFLNLVGISPARYKKFWLTGKIKA